MNAATSTKRNEGNWQQWIGQVVCRHYVIIEKMDQGSFGFVFKARRQPDPSNKHVNTQGDDLYAVKIEDNTGGGVNKNSQHDTLTREAKILFDLKAEKGFTRMYYYIKNEKINTMVTTLLDKSIEKLFNLCKKKFSLKTVLMIADQMLSRLQYFHQKGYVHRDIKPDNFMIGRGEEKNQIFLIDFGLSKSYLKKNGSHIDFSDKIGLVGTTRYTSIQSHQGMEQSRRDDLESLGYTLIYFLKGNLPWMDLKARSKQEHQKLIAQVKQKTTILELCQEIPNEFHKFMTYVRGLGFFDEPNYNYLKRLFRTLFLKENFQYDDFYDWIKDEPTKGNEKRNMFEKFKSVNPMLTSKVDHRFIEFGVLDKKNEQNSKAQDEIVHCQNDLVGGASHNTNQLDVAGFKRKNTRKSTQEYKKPIELQLREEEDELDEYKEELVDNVYDLSNQFSKGIRPSGDADSSEFDVNKVNSNTFLSSKPIGNTNKQLNDKQSSTDINNTHHDFDFDFAEDVIYDEDTHHLVDQMLRKLTKIQMNMQAY